MPNLVTFIKHRPLLTFNIRFNPLGPDGGAAILNAFDNSSIETYVVWAFQQSSIFIWVFLQFRFDMSCCDIDHSIDEPILQFLWSNKQLKSVNLSSNMLGIVSPLSLFVISINARYHSNVRYRQLALSWPTVSKILIIWKSSTFVTVTSIRMTSEDWSRSYWTIQPLRKQQIKLRLYIFFLFVYFIWTSICTTFFLNYAEFLSLISFSFILL